MIKAKVEPIERDVALALSEALSPQARGAQIAAFAREELKRGQERNRAALGRVPEHDTFVDGRAEAPLESVRSTIVFEFELLTDVFVWIRDALVKHSPKLSGKYAKNHVFLADGSEVLVSEDVPPAREYTFINAVPYARKIERGLSKQAPDGVYQVVAALAAKRFGNLARIRFTYRALLGTGKGKNSRQPAIAITV